ncbi:hypothetical protein AB0901_30665, partial [Streptomyces roseifaciens]
PFWGTRVIKGIGLKDYASWLDEGALFKGQWGPAASAGRCATCGTCAQSEQFLMRDGARRTAR